MKTINKYLSIIVAMGSLTACTSNYKMGEFGEIRVDQHSAWLTSSVTVVANKKLGTEQVYVGPSIVSQTLQPVASATAGALIGRGLGKSGAKVSQGQTSTAAGTATSKSDASSSSNSTSTVNIGE